MARTTSVSKDKPTATHSDLEPTDPGGASPTKTYLNWLKSGAGVLYALLHTLLAAFAAQFMALSSKAGMPVLQLVFLAQLLQFIFVLVMTPLFRPRLTTEGRRQTVFLTLSAVTNNVAVTLEYMSFHIVLPGIAFGIIKGSLPLVTACIGYLVLQETVGAVDCLGIALSVTGVIMVAVEMMTDPDNDTWSTERLATSICLPLAATFAGRGPNAVVERSLVGLQGVSVLTINFYGSLLGTVALLALTYALETPRWTMSAQTMGYVVGLCVCDCGQTFAAELALRTEKAGIVAAIQTFTVPLAVLLDYLILREVPNLLTCGGVVLVVAGTGVVAVYTWRGRRKDILRKNFLDSLNFGK
ncbi:hypothetical protein Bbelb_229610 [Branchiostoma belcheri]|nr:hypothetical protein Bbelb_229610 [Branchiostoma belcheri]